MVSKEAAMAHQAITQKMTDDEFDSYVMDLLARELGPGGYARYIALHRSGRGDYTADRHQWLAGVTIEDIERELKANSPT
jgi:hypothetical protein